MLGTAAVKPCQLASPPNPAWLVEEYNHPDVCQLVRVWVPARNRRRRVGRTLAELPSPGAPARADTGGCTCTPTPA
ncbi:MAG TPA: hypothetical protein VI248_10325 [Kineosporiaceae bacterium]